MDAGSFALKLKHKGYRENLTFNNNIRFYLKDTSAERHIAVIVNYVPGYAGTGEELDRLSSKLSYDYGTEKILFVIFTSNVFEARVSLIGKFNCWFYDIENNKAIIYDDQPYEFYGIRELLEKETPEIFRKVFTLNNLVIVINIIIYIILDIMGDVDSAQFLYEHGGAYPDGLFKEHEVYRLFTSMFMHSGIRHIGSNMLVLFFIGDNLERAVGKIKYPIIYLGSGLIAGIVSQVYYYLSGRYYVVCVGASGAIFGVIGALIWILIVNKGRLEDLSLRRMLIYVFLSIVLGLSSTNVSMSAHIGGLIGGFCLATLLYRKRGFST